MNVHISVSVIAQARDVTSLTTEEVTNLVDESAAATVIGIFPVGLHFASERWVHLLRGDGVEDADDPQHVAVFKFVSSAASFRVKQILRRRRRVKDAGARPAKCCPNCGHRITTAAEQPRSLSDVE
jgi:hypothetical protein